MGFDAESTELCFAVQSFISTYFFCYDYYSVDVSYLPNQVSLFSLLSPHCESSEVGELMTNRLAVKTEHKAALRKTMFWFLARRVFWRRGARMKEQSAEEETTPTVIEF